MKIFSRDNPWRLIYLGLILFLVIGYSLFFLAYFFSTPEWGKALMAYFAPIVKRLNNAARVSALTGGDPFPAQVVILYCAWGSIVLTIWNLYWGIFKSALREAAIEKFHALLTDKKHKCTRTKLVLYGLLMPVFLVFLGYVAFWSFSPDTTIDWREISFYSSRIGSVTFLFLSSLTLATTFFMFIGMAIAGMKRPSQKLLIKEKQ